MSSGCDTRAPSRRRLSPSDGSRVRDWLCAVGSSGSDVVAAPMKAFGWASRPSGLSVSSSLSLSDGCVMLGIEESISR